MKGILRAVGYFVLYAGATIFFQMGLSAALMAAAAASGLSSEEQIVGFAGDRILGITIVSGVLTTAVLFFVFKARKKDIRQEWRLKAFRKESLPAACLASFSFSFLFALFTYDIPMENSIMIAKSAAYYSGLCPMLGQVLTAANLLLVAPAAEEITLRGIVYTRVEKTTNTAVAIAVSSVLFGLMHLAAGGPVLVAGAALMAAVFGYIFCKTGSLWVCIAAHAAANLPDLILYGHPALSGGVLLGLKIAFACCFAAGLWGVGRAQKMG